MKSSTRKGTSPNYGRIRTPEDLGALARAERHQQALNLSDVHETTGIGMRFLSEFERGKPNASLGRVMDTLKALGLEVLILPRGEAQRLLALRKQDRPVAGRKDEA